MATETATERSPQYTARVLKAGSFELMLEHPDLTPNGEQCLTPGSAVLMDLKSRHIRVPEAFEWESIQGKIHPAHQERIKKIHEAAAKKKRDFDVNLANLKALWEKAPEITDLDVIKVMEETGTRIRENYEKALAAILAIPLQGEEPTPPSELELWQSTDKRLREGVYKLDKDLLTALRNYYEALLERPPQQEKKDKAKKEDESRATENPDDYVLQVPHNDPLRWQIMKEIRYLRLIDGVHQSIAIAKAAHHTQPGGRVRKSGNIPYVYHPIAVMNDTILDAVVQFIEEERLPLDFIMLIVAAALHDLLEDSGQTLDEIVDFFARMADKYDSSIPIESGYGIPKAQFQKKVLDLFSGSTRSNVRKILHILSDNSPLTTDEKNAAFQKNWAGPKETKKLLGVTDEEQKQWEQKPREEERGNGKGKRDQPALNTFRQFPEEPRKGKMSAFLVRMSGILKGERDEIKKIGQATLIIKMEDRRHNLSTMEGKTIPQKFGQLRETTARLIAYAMLDHDQENYSLYNALPHLIDTTIEQYEEVIANPEASELITENDREYIRQLKIWEATVKRYPIPESVNAILTHYHDKRKTTTDAELAAVPEPRRGLLKLLERVGVLKPSAGHKSDQEQ